jgi:acylphosphatase
MSIEARHFVVRGRVQGVGFRHHTKLRARELGLVGWVRNRPDGSVEVVAQGPAHDLDVLADCLRRGPPTAEVASVTARTIEPEVGTGTFRVEGLGR